MATPYLMLARLVLTLLAVMSVTACGQKGPLYMPNKVSVQPQKNNNTYAASPRVTTNLGPNHLSTRPVKYLST